MITNGIIMEQNLERGIKILLNGWLLWKNVWVELE
jgi:hypothetical protein